MSQPTIRTAFEEYPILVVSIDAPPERIREALKQFIGREVSVKELLEALEKVGKEVRLHGAFSPRRWHDPETFGYYGWATKPAKEKLGNEKVEIILIDNILDRIMLPAVYHGFGIASIKYTLRDGVEESGEPIAVAIKKPAKPRNIVVFTFKEDKPGREIEAYTADQILGLVLERAGYRKTNGYKYIKTYDTIEKAVEDIEKIDREARTWGAYVFRVGELGRTRKRIKPLIEI